MDTRNVPGHRIRRSRDEWQQLIDDYQRSGLNPQQYCAQNDLNLYRFRLWQRRLDPTILDGLFVEVQPEDHQDECWTIELRIGDLSLKLKR